MKKLIVTIIILLVTTITFAQDSTTVEALTTVTSLSAADDFYVEWDSSGTKVARSIEWSDLKDLLASELVFNQAGLRVVAATDTIIRVDASGNLYLGDKSIVPIYIANGGDIGLGLTTPESPLHLYSATNNTPTFIIESEHGNTVGGSILLKLDSSSPADDDQLGYITGQGDDSGGNPTNYGTISFYSDDVTDTDEHGRIRFTTLMDGTSRTMLDLDGSRGSVDAGQILLNPDNQDVRVGVGTSTPADMLHIYDDINATPYITLESEQAGNTGGGINFYLNSSTPADGDLLGGLDFEGKDSGGTKDSYALIGGYSSDATATDEAGKVFIGVQLDGSSALTTNLFEVNGYNGSVGEGFVKVNEVGLDVDFIVESDNKADALVVDAAEDSVYINAPKFSLQGIKFDTTGQNGADFVLANAGGGFWTQTGSDIYYTTGQVGIGTNSPGTELHVYATTLSDPDIKIESVQDGATGGSLNFTLDSSTPADGDELGDILFIGDDDGGAAAQFAGITGSATDVTNLDEAGQLELKVRVDNVLRSIWVLNGYNGSVGEGDITFNGDAEDINFFISSVGVDSALAIDGSNGNVFMEGLGSGTGTQLSRVANTDQIVEETSSRRFKSNVKSWNPKADISKFKTVSFKWNKKSANAGQKGYGLIAEDVAKLLPEAAQYDEDGKVKNYDNRVVMAYLISVVQEQQEQLEELRALVFKEHYQ